MNNTDPFEEAASSSAVTIPPLPLREPSIQQAVTFLSDPRVKSQHLSKAVTFLRNKGLTEAELREAFQRTSLPFPPTFTDNQQQFPSSFLPSASFHPQQQQQQPFLPPPAHHQQIQQGRPGWFSFILSLTAAAGLITAVREALRTYVVPLYFPTSSASTTSVTTRNSTKERERDKQISELHERIKDLCVTSEKTNQRVDQLSRSLSSSLAIRDRELSATAELRDAIRQLSHSVTMSTTDVRDQTSRFEDTSMKVDREKEIEKDEFMDMEPAAIEDSWKVYNNITNNIDNTPQSRASVKASSTVLDRTEQQAETSNHHIENSTNSHENEITKINDSEDDINNGLTEDNLNNGVDRLGEENTNAEIVADNQFIDESEIETNEEGENESENGNELVEDEIIENSVDSKTKITTAKQLFESEVMAEARQLFHNNLENSNDKVSRRLSMPLLDGPLSDVES